MLESILFEQLCRSRRTAEAAADYGSRPGANTVLSLAAVAFERKRQETISRLLELMYEDSSAPCRLSH